MHRGDYYSARRESFFFEYVRQKLVERYGAKKVQQGGLKVYTTIDLNMQRLARKAIGEVLNEPEDPASAIVTINPANGDIEAMAESESYEKSQYNLAADGHRQPGSTFKAIDLADALSHGIDPNSTYYLSHTLAAGLAAHEPRIRSQDLRGHLAEQAARTWSRPPSPPTTPCTPSWPPTWARNRSPTPRTTMGVRTHLSSYPAEALGGLTLGVTPLEMAVVYATLADGGWRNSPIAITKVVFPDGNVDNNWGTPHRVKALTEAVTGAETSILQDNVQSGTATRSAINCPTAAKTGTTSNLIDAWLDGYTPRYSTVVWMGYPNRRVEMTDVHGEPQQGGYLPAEIWHDYMAAVTEGKPCVPFAPSNEAPNYVPFFGKYSVGWQQKQLRIPCSPAKNRPRKPTNRGPSKRPPPPSPAKGRPARLPPKLHPPLPTPRRPRATPAAPPPAESHRRSAGRPPRVRKPPCAPARAAQPADFHPRHAQRW